MRNAITFSNSGWLGSVFWALKDKIKTAYDEYTKLGKSNDCGKFLKYFLKESGYDYSGLRDANEIIRFMRGEYPSVSLEDAIKAAQEGNIVVVGTDSGSGHGHVAGLSPDSTAKKPLLYQKALGRPDSRSVGVNVPAIGAPWAAWNRNDFKNATFHIIGKPSPK